MDNLKTDTIKGVLLAIIGFSLFAIGDAIYKYVSPFYSIYVMGFFGSLFGTIAMLVYCRLTGGIKNALKTGHLRLHILRGILLLAQFLLAIYALQQISLAKFYALVFAAPFITTILSIPLLGQSVDWKRWASVIVGFIGVLIVLRPGIIPLEPASIACLSAAVLFSVANLLAGKIGTGKESPLSFGLYVELVITPCIFLLALPDFTLPSLPHLGLLAFCGVSGAVALVALAIAFAKAPAAVAAPFHYTQMLWGIALGYVVFGDVMDLWTGIGAAIIIASGLWLIRTEHRKIPDIGTV
ncbi:MAG: DMT family transporter [Rhodospirillales bacterium]|nr:DMT family transporter [Rhodospirillales bacterium]MCB9996348.1 DMT family transporter [Rhodospirillales bacterium]